VQAFWRQGKWANTVFDLASRDPWPDNFFQTMTDQGVNPMDDLMQLAAAVKTTHHRKGDCFAYPWGGGYCQVDSYPEVYGESIWRFLRSIMNGSSLWQPFLVSPQYPSALDLPLN
jgi:hypothetical protein